ncbi:MAG: DUF2520 domain-containing protein [Flavobacteriales bacterium]|nr:DUF2520 domain-containing protein [Flavobacteriales bacterium]
MSRVSIIGGGNVANAFGRRLHERGVEIVQLYSRDRKVGEELAEELEAIYIDSLDKIEPKVDVIILAVSDDALSEVAKELPSTEALVMHCSGSTPLSVLPQKNRAVIWPLRSIAKGQKMTWDDINMVLEADSDIASVRAMELIERFGSKPVKMDSKERRTAHLVAVILNNFSNHLLHIADVLCMEQGMDRRIFQDLMEHTLEYSGPAIDSQTGPAAREDLKVLDRQMKLLKKHPHFQKVYESVSTSIIIEKNDKEL